MSCNLSISCRFKLYLTNGISILTHEFVYRKILKISDTSITDIQNKQKMFQSKYTQHILCTGCKLCPTYVSAWTLKLPSSEKSVSIETGVLSGHFGSRKVGVRLDKNPFEISIKRKYIDLLKWLMSMYSL